MEREFLKNVAAYVCHERKQRSGMGCWLRCCISDGGGSSVAALQGVVANHRTVRRSRAGVLSVAEKARLRSCQVWARKASESEPLWKRRNALLTSKPRTVGIFEMKPEGYLSTALAVSGVKGARAWSGRWYGTWEPVVPIGRAVQLDAGWPPLAGRGRTPSR